MPVEIPDPSVHKVCIRCHRCFRPDEGQLRIPEATGPLSGMRLTAASLAGDETSLRFICHGCIRARRITKAAIWSSLFILIGGALFVAWLRGEL